ncbi:MAG: GtrA family protein [Bacteroidales bacterium]|nr:GtrA family protein [Bacteroidales bacterium]
MGRTIEIISNFPKFVLAEGLGTVVDTAVLWILSHFVFQKYAGEYLIAPVISFECAVFTNYCTAFFYVWGDRIKSRTFKNFLRKYVLYNLSASAVFLIKMVFLLMFELLFGWSVVICNLAALCISGLINFSIGEWVIFKRKK